MVLLQLKASLELFVKRREFPPDSGFLSLSNTGELGYDGLNGTRKIGPSYAKSVIHI